jgi:hypothetical protein
VVTQRRSRPLDVRQDIQSRPCDSKKDLSSLPRRYDLAVRGRGWFIGAHISMSAKMRLHTSAPLASNRLVDLSRALLNRLHESPDIRPYHDLVTIDLQIRGILPHSQMVRQAHRRGEPVQSRLCTGWDVMVRWRMSEQRILVAPTDSECKFCNQRTTSI